MSVNQMEWTRKFNELGFKREDLILTELLQKHKDKDKVGGVRPIYPYSDTERTLRQMNNVKYDYLQNTKDEILYIFDDSNREKLMMGDMKISKFMDAGANTIVFSIMSRDRKQFVLKVQKFDRSRIEEYITLFQTNYKRDYTVLLRNNCPNIYSCGLLIRPMEEEDTNYCLFYTIMEKYDTIMTYLKYNRQLTFFQSFNVLKSLTSRLKVLHKNNYYLRDLKMDNLGYSNTFDPIFIDYDPYVCQKYQGTENDLPCDTIFLGNTYYPYYIMERITMGNSGPRITEFVGMYKHMDVIGFADVILNLFFRPLYNKKEEINEYMSALYEGGEFMCGQLKLLLEPIPQGKTIMNASQNIGNLQKVLNFTRCFTRLYDGNEIEIKFGRTIREYLLNSNGKKGFMHTEFNKIYGYDELNSYLSGLNETLQTMYSLDITQEELEINAVIEERRRNREILLRESKKRDNDNNTNTENVVSNNENINNNNNNNNRNNENIELPNKEVIKKIKYNSIGGKKYKIIFIQR